jgi:hypothetical protein
MANPSLDFLTIITKIEASSAMLVLDLATGVGAPQTGIPPLTLSGIPGAPGARNVFTSSMILPKPGKEVVPIIDPVSPGMLSNLLTWTTQKKTAARTGFEYLFCNIGAMRGQQKGGDVVLLFKTPGPSSVPPIPQTWYWIEFAGGGPFTPTVSPLFPTPGPSFGYYIAAVWADTPGQPGTGNQLKASAFTILPPGTPPYFFGGLGGPVSTVFQMLNLINAEQAALGLSPASLIQQNFPINQPDTTEWSIRGGIWVKQKSFAALTPAGGLPNWPVLPPAVQPTSTASAAGFSVPSRTVTVTVTPSPGNTLTIS